MSSPNRFLGSALVVALSVCSAPGALGFARGSGVCAAGDELDVLEVVSKARAALGLERLVEHPGAVRMRGSALMRGTQARQTDTFDGRGRRLQVFDGPLAMSSGFDGTTAWSVDWNRTARALELGDRIDADLSAGFLYGTWAGVGSGLGFVSARPVQGDVELAFQDPAETFQGTLRIDGTSYLPESVTWTSSGSESTWTYGPFADHDGFRFPESVTLLASGSTQTLATESIEFLEHVQADLFAPRPSPGTSTSFDADVPAELEVRRARSGHLLVKAEIDGEDMGWFIFDTGAGTNCISTAVAHRLSAGPFGEMPARGIGGTVTSSFWRADHLRVGPLVMEGTVFLGLDLAFLDGPMGVQVAGILGYETIARCVVEFDLDAPYIAFHDPETYELAAEGTWEEVFLNGRHPNVRATFEGHEGIFKIDTGAAGSSIMFHAPAVRAFGLAEGRATSPSSIGGVGGRVAVLQAELASFELGGHAFGPMQVVLGTSEEGALTDPHVVGTMGGRMIEPFLLVFDYPHKRVGFVPEE